MVTCLSNTCLISFSQEARAAECDLPTKRARHAGQVRLEVGKDLHPRDVLEFGERGWLRLGGEEEKITLWLRSDAAWYHEQR